MHGNPDIYTLLAMVTGTYVAGLGFLDRLCLSGGEKEEEEGGSVGVGLRREREGLEMASMSLPDQAQTLAQPFHNRCNS